jgi:hypothetical protein
MGERFSTRLPTMFNETTMVMALYLAKCVENQTKWSNNILKNPNIHPLTYSGIKVM